MKLYDVCSLSAPQIGLPLQIFVMELNKEYLECFNKQVRDILQISLIPPTVSAMPHIF